MVSCGVRAADSLKCFTYNSVMDLKRSDELIVRVELWQCIRNAVWLASAYTDFVVECKSDY